MSAICVWSVILEVRRDMTSTQTYTHLASRAILSFFSCVPLTTERWSGPEIVHNYWFSLTGYNRVNKKYKGIYLSWIVQLPNTRRMVFCFKMDIRFGTKWVNIILSQEEKSGELCRERVKEDEFLLNSLIFFLDIQAHCYLKGILWVNSIFCLLYMYSNIMGNIENCHMCIYLWYIRREHWMMFNFWKTSISL